jgi:hypothetical protein
LRNDAINAIKRKALQDCNLSDRFGAAQKNAYNETTDEKPFDL